MKDGNQKQFIPQLAIDTEFFHLTFANTCVGCKTKGAVRAVYTFLRNLQLGA
jgi:hypothetical protein